EPLTALGPQRPEVFRDVEPQHRAAHPGRQLDLRAVLPHTSSLGWEGKCRGRGARDTHASSYATGATLVASGPFEPSRCSNVTRAPSASVLKPSPAMLLWCTNTSFAPSSGLMKP